MDVQYIFVVDTNRYAGNFERGMCAYMTGQIGDCEVGKEIAEIARKEIPEIVAKLEDMVSQVPDEHGCSRPASIFQNPRYGNDGMGKHEVVTEANQKDFSYPAYNSVAVHFSKIPNRELIDIMKRRAEVFASKKMNCKKIGDSLIGEIITIEGFRLLEKTITIGYTQLDCQN